MNPTSLALLQTVVTSDTTLSQEQKLSLRSLIEGRPTSQNSPPEKLLLTQKDTAKLLSISRVTLWRMTRDGILHPVEILPGTHRYRLDELQAFARSGKANSAIASKTRRRHREVV